MAQAKFTRERVARLCKAIEGGNFIGTACRLAGLTDGTFRRWRRRGQADIAAGSRTRFARFVEAVNKAETASEMAALQNIRDAAQHKQHWTAAAWYLERRFPERWSKREHVDHQVEVVFSEDRDTVGTPVRLAASRKELQERVSESADLLSSEAETGRSNGSGPEDRT